MDLISIIIPVYNAESYLEDCIISILSQTYKNIEVILVNDGSTDRSIEICKQYESVDKRVVLISLENGGVSRARNVGLSVANGKYVMFCDSDDTVEYTWCEKMYECMLSNEVGIAICDFYFYYGNDNKKKAIKRKNLINTYWDVYYNDLLNPPWNKMYRMDLIKEHDIHFDENISYNEDLIFVIKYINAMNNGFILVKEPLYNYRKTDGISLSKKYVNNLWEIKKIVFYNLDEMINNYNIFFDTIKTEYYSKWISAILLSVNNEINKAINMNSKLNFDSLKKMNGILKSNECKVAFRYGLFDSNVSERLAMVYKSRSIVLLMLYFSLGKIKSYFSFKK